MKVFLFKQSARICLSLYIYKLVCTEEKGCVRHPPDCDGFTNADKPCIIRLRTSRDETTKSLNVKILQRYNWTNNVTTAPNFTFMAENETILPLPANHDLMFFIIGKKSAKEKYMFMCHLGKKKVQIICCLS